MTVLRPADACAPGSISRNRATAFCVATAPRTRRGFALLAVLIFVMLLSMVTVSLLFR